MADQTVFDRIRPAATSAMGALMLAAIAAAGTAAQQEGEVVSAGDGGAIDPRAIAETRRLGQRSFSPYANRKFPTAPLWGDQHVHTEWSFDAGFLATVGPEEALKLARGEQVLSTFGVPVRLSRPLDWVVMTDHSDSLGLTAALRAGDPQLLQDPTMKKWSEGMKGNLDQIVATAMGAIQAQSKGTIPEIAKSPALLQQNWEQYTAIIERYNSPGLFTALIGYEWTPNPGPGNNLHRNLVYRDGKDRADRATPLTTYDSVDPEVLWQWMGDYEQTSGGRILRHSPQRQPLQRPDVRAGNLRRQADDQGICRGPQPLGAPV